MDIVIDPNSSTPLYQQIHDGIVAGIADGELGPGDALVSVRALADALGVNPATVVKAYDLLRREGFVSTADRSGTVITSGQMSMGTWPERLARLMVEGRARGLDEDALLARVRRAMGG